MLPVMRVLLILVAAACSHSGSADPFKVAPAPSAGEIKGLVQDSATKAPVAGVTITLGSTTVTSAADGTWSATAPAGRMLLTASASGYLRWSNEVLVSSTSATEIVRLVPLASATAIGGGRRGGRECRRPCRRLSQLERRFR